MTFYPPELNSTVLNSDWFYRKMIPGVFKPVILGIQNLNVVLTNLMVMIFDNFKKFVNNLMFNNKVFDRETGFDTLIVVQIFGLILFILMFMHFN